jgi:DNA-binding LytR/AlgR family response regulator
MKLRCLIVDDEQGAHLVLKNYIDRIDKLELVGDCYSATEAMNFMLNQQVDVLFLDINMPDITGLEMLESFTSAPKTILTTAYSEFAMDGFDLGVSDYLLKPIPFPRFIKAINRVIKDIDKTKSTETEASEIFINVDGERIKLALADVLYVQSWGNYIKVFVKNKFYLTAMTTQDFDEILPSSQFIRIHRSYVVSIAAIKKITSTYLQIDTKELPIGTTYRQKVNEKLKERR